MQLELAMKHSIALAVLLYPASLLLTIAAVEASSPCVLQVCNRGFRYTKKEPLHQRRAAGLNFCTDSVGHVRDCQLFEILGTEDVEFEAVECTSNSCKRMQEDIKENEGHAQVYSTVDGDAMEMMDLDQSDAQHISWKERPKRGRCYDNALSYEFDCNLVEILE